MKPKIMPPTYFMILLVLAVVFNFIFPIRTIVRFPYNHLGWVLVLEGVVLNIWADGIFKKRKTTVKPGEKSSELVIKGPFKISRNPMYFGMVLILLGVAVVCGDLVSFLFPIIFIILIEFLFIPLEEREMQSIFGKKYLNYKKHVRRWV